MMFLTALRQPSHCLYVHGLSLGGMRFRIICGRHGRRMDHDVRLYFFHQFFYLFFMGNVRLDETVSACRRTNVGMQRAAGNLPVGLLGKSVQQVAPRKSVGSYNQYFLVHDL